MPATEFREGDRDFEVAEACVSAVRVRTPVEALFEWDKDIIVVNSDVDALIDLEWEAEVESGGDLSP